MNANRKWFKWVLLGGALAVVFAGLVSPAAAAQRTPKAKIFRSALSGLLSYSGISGAKVSVAPATTQSITLNFNRFAIDLILKASAGGCPSDDKLDDIEDSLEDFSANLAGKFGFTSAQLVSNNADVDCDDGDITATIKGLWLRT